MGDYFKMPKLGMDMEEGTIIKWLKAEGDAVKKGEALAEIETDKSSVEVEAQAEGILRKQYHPEGACLPCGTPIAFIGAADEAIPAAEGAVEEAAPAQEAAPAAQPEAAGNDELFFNMPKLGMDMEEGTVVKWLKAEGDAVKKGEALAEIETDKSTVEVESLLSGVILKLYYEEGATVPCNQPIAAIGPAGTPVPALPGAAPAAAEQPAAAPAAPVAAAPQVSAPAARPVVSAAPAAALTPGGRIRSSPRARRLAAKYQVDLAFVAGTGANGRIIEQDVRDYLESGAQAAPVQARRIPSDTVVPMTGVRKVTARRMRQSLESTAQTHHTVGVDMSNLQAFRKQVNARLESQGVKVSIVDILTMACAKALMEHPMANATLLADGLHMHNYVNIGVACDTEKGLVVPVVRDVDILSLADLAKASRAAIDKARKGELKPEDMSGGTFTISNLGMFEIDNFVAVLNPPETCILAVGRIADRVVAEQGQMVIRPMMNLCLTYDHQVLDGAPAARFLQTLKHYLENPVWLMM